MKHLEILSGDTTLAALLDEVTATQKEIILTQNGTPVARIVPCTTKNSLKQNYPLRGMPITISEDFDEPMPELWALLRVLRVFSQGETRRERGSKIFLNRVDTKWLPAG